MSSKPLVVIAGPTASGKTSLAIDLAQRYGGEIVCADSRTIYRGMDIGTAKPSVKEQSSVPHHLLDVVDPGQKFTVAQFKELAEQAIGDIRRRDKLPLLVGGTGLYVDSVILDYQFGGKIDETKRQQLEKESLESLQQMHIAQHLSMPENSKNKRHLVNNLLRAGNKTSRKSQPDSDNIVVGIATDSEALRSRIEQRAYAMFEKGVVKEAKELARLYGWESEAMTGNIYPIIKRLISGEIDQEQALEQLITNDWRLAKRQLTWLKRHDFIKWFSLTEANDYLSTILDRY